MRFHPRHTGGLYKVISRRGIPREKKKRYWKDGSLSVSVSLILTFITALQLYTVLLRYSRIDDPILDEGDRPCAHLAMGNCPAPGCEVPLNSKAVQLTAECCTVNLAYCSGVTRVLFRVGVIIINNQGGVFLAAHHVRHSAEPFS